MTRTTSIEPTYGPLIDVCHAFGISRSVAYELVSDGMLDTFKLRARRYVYIESVRTLPERLSVTAGSI